MERPSYLNNGHGLASWLLTKDHKRIALLYLVSITVFFVLGGLFALFDPARAADAGRRPAVEPRPTTRCSPCTAW